MTDVPLSIKPCPFCGSAASIGETSKFGYKWYFAYCPGEVCEIAPRPDNGWSTREAAIEAWNKRYIDKELELKNIIKSALRIKSLWLPPDDLNPEHYGEGQALIQMYNAFLNAIEEGGNQ